MSDFQYISFGCRACSALRFSRRKDSAIRPDSTLTLHLFPARWGEGEEGAPVRARILLLAVGINLAVARIAAAAPTQQDIFKSIQDNVSEKSDPRWMIFIIAAGAAVLMVLALLGMRNQRGATPKTLNHQGKLLREIRRHVAIKSSEMKQLKLMVDQVKTPDGKPLVSPITLLLCPSLLVKSAQVKSARINRRVLGGLVRKLQEPVTKD
jgi:hypothetical protein